jgi:hypothetical protein
VAGVVLDALAEAHFLHHFEVVIGAHFQALGFDEFALFLKGSHLLVAFLADVVHGCFHLGAFGDELLGREKGV